MPEGTSTRHLAHVCPFALLLALLSHQILLAVFSSLEASKLLLQSLGTGQETTAAHRRQLAVTLAHRLSTGCEDFTWRRSSTTTTSNSKQARIAREVAASLVALPARTRPTRRTSEALGGTVSSFCNETLLTLEHSSSVPRRLLRLAIARGLRCSSPPS